MLGSAVQTLYVFAKKDRDRILIELWLFQAQLTEFIGSKTKGLSIGYIKHNLQVLSRMWFYPAAAMVTLALIRVGEG